MVETLDIQDKPAIASTDAGFLPSTDLGLRWILHTCACHDLHLKDAEGVSADAEITRAAISYLL